MPAQANGSRWVAGWAITAAVVSTCAGCNGKSEPPLANAQTSATAVAQLVLDAIAHRNEVTLRALALDEAEFKVHVWPSLPAARPERNLPFSYVWGELRQKSEASLAVTLATHGGRRYELLDVQFDESPSDYSGFLVHRGTRLSVRTESGAHDTLRVCGSLIEKDGAWKVFSYVVDD